MAEFGKIVGSAVGLTALVAAGFTAGSWWHPSPVILRPQIKWVSGPTFDSQWECMEGGDTSAVMLKVNLEQPTPDHIIPVCGAGIFRVWYRKDHSGFQYDVETERLDTPKAATRDFMERQMNDPNKVVLYFGSEGARGIDQELVWFRVKPPEMGKK